MGRIEENEAERMERVRQERKYQEQQLKTKQLAEDQQFRAYVVKSQDTKKQDAKGDQQRSEQNHEASRVLLARRGISANQTSKTFANQGAKDNSSTRSRLDGQARERERLQQDLGRRGNADGSAQSGRASAMGVGRGGSKSGQDGASQGQGQGQQHRATNEAQLTPSTSYAAIGQAAVQALDGMGARASAGSQVAEQAEKLREMMAAIVKGVKQGVTEHGFGAIEIELNDDVLGGTKLMVLNSQSGIHLKVDTGEYGTSQHERPNEALLKSSAHELHQAMQAAKLNLVGLEINGERVIA